MDRLRLVSLGLFLMLLTGMKAQTAQSQAIVGPDGRSPSRLAPRPAQPALEEQLRRKKNRDPARELPSADQPATATEELLGTQASGPTDAPQEVMNIKEPDPWLRMHLGLALVNAQKVAGPVETWRFEPGIIWQAAFRVSDPEKSYTFWTGLHLAAWNGTAQSSTSFSRFSALYAGPLLAFEWRGKPRQTLAFGLAGLSRQADPNFPGEAHKLATQAFGLDGSGLWLNYGLGFRIAPNLEWETKAGLQSGSAYLLSYVSLGVSLWTD